MTAPMPVRVMVTPVWDEVALDLAPETPVVDLKRQALGRALVAGDPDDYLVKYRGAQLIEETKSLAEHGVVANAALIVLPRRRRPVR